MSEVYWGDSIIHELPGGSQGELLQFDGEPYYRISNYSSMAPFLMAVVSGADHWMFVSSTGGLTCGRRNPAGAVFPYYTDDKIHDAWSTTGPLTSIKLRRGGRTWLWKPFWPQPDVYGVERNLYKNLAGTRVMFEEINPELGLSFRYSWSSSDAYGFVRKCSLVNIGRDGVELELLDGLRNLLPQGIDPALQTGLSTLMDAYKQAEAVPGCTAALFTMSSIPTDRAEPSESLKATIAWCRGLDAPAILLSEDQCRLFDSDAPLRAEKTARGKRGAFFVHCGLELGPAESRDWYVLCDVNKGPSDVVALIGQVRAGVAAEDIEADVDAGLLRLGCRVGNADGYQKTSDALVSGRHFSNTLFNIMRGGIFYDGYHFPTEDFERFTREWNTGLVDRLDRLFGRFPASLTRDSVLEAAQDSGDSDMERIALEYLPLTFSRRHGDPSRPWNRFSIDIRNADGSERLYYQGNWRDIFQNWEALALSYPEYLESFVAKFVNASTADGHNPYRITRDGFDWEILEPDDPWSNIGYWGDHQVNYLLKLLEMSHRYHPGRISNYLDRQIFVYANVPYRIKPYQALLQDPRNSVDYDDALAGSIAERVRGLGSDGKLVTGPDGSVLKVSLAEKLLVPALVKLGNFVPGGGIWMNTQRPEWNDANNALAGYGLSMVTLCYLRRYLVFLEGILAQSGRKEFLLSSEVSDYVAGLHRLLNEHSGKLETGFTAADRKSMVDALGAVSESYRESVYGGFSGKQTAIALHGLLAFIDLSVAYLDQCIAQNRRADGLFHAYNLIDFAADGYSVGHLQEMLEGQVAVLSSGFLGACDSLDLLRKLESSRIYRSDQNSYMLYPYRELPSFLEKNTMEPSRLRKHEWLSAQLDSGRSSIVEKDVNGKAHFNGRFRNKDDLRLALENQPGIGEGEIDAVCDLFEEVFNHRQFTGRSGAMFKYEGLGCIYWHMVSKLLLATGEVIEAANRASVERDVLEGLKECFDRIQAGIGVHKSPEQYGAMPMDPYSHTTGFGGVQQPGMTGQVKEDIITRFAELGVTVEQGEVIFQPVLLRKSEFMDKACTWTFAAGGSERSLDLEPGMLAFMLCGVPVIYRLARSAAIEVDAGDAGHFKVSGNRLGADWSSSLFRRENRVDRLLVDLPEAMLRD